MFARYVPQQAHQQHDADRAQHQEAGNRTDDLASGERHAVASSRDATPVSYPRATLPRRRIRHHLAAAGSAAMPTTSMAQSRPSAKL